MGFTRLLVIFLFSTVFLSSVHSSTFAQSSNDSGEGAPEFNSQPVIHLKALLLNENPLFFKADNYLVKMTLDQSVKDKTQVVFFTRMLKPHRVEHLKGHQQARFLAKQNEYSCEKGGQIRRNRSSEWMQGRFKSY